MKRALPLVVLAVAVSGVITLIVLAVKAPNTNRPAVPVGVIRPALRVINEAGLPVQSGSLLVGSGAAFDLRISIEANAFVYLFDEAQGQLTLVWKHDEAVPWEKGEYSAEAPAFQGLGEHQLIVVASPSPAATVETWKVITPEALQTLCPQCEANTYAFFVRGDVADAGQ